MKTSKELREERAGIIDKMAAIYSLSEKENRSRTDAEKTEWNKLKKQSEDLESEIRDAEEMEKLNAEKATVIAGNQRGKKETETEKREKEVKSYSIIKAMRSQLPNQKLEGYELEMHQEAEKEARELGIELQGIGIPSMIVNAEKRASLVAGTDAAGGHTVPEDKMGLIEALRPKLMTQQLGANVMTGLRGNISFPTHSGVTSASWATETGTATQSDPTFGEITMTPKRLAAWTEYSKQLLYQSSIDVENLVRNDLATAIQIALDLAAINGSGASNQPTGILNITGIGDVAGGTNGAVPTHANIVALETAIAVDNADMGKLAYLTTPGIRGTLKTTKIDAGSGKMIWENNAGGLNGYRAEVSTQVPSTLTKGTASGTAHAIIFANWAELMIGQWGGVDLVVNPYTSAKAAKVEVIINSFWDIALRHPESFAAMKDALTA